MSFYHDPEVPAGFQDADIEQYEMEEAGRAIAAARRAGRCTHQSAVGFRPEPLYPEQMGLTLGELRCTDGCNRIFASDEEWDDAREAAVYG